MTGYHFNYHKLRNSAVIIVAMVASAANITVSAQETTTEKRWSLEQCISYALEHNLELKQKNIAYQQTEIDVYSSKGALFPSLSFTTNQSGSWLPWSKSYVNVQNGTMATTSSSVNYNGSYGLQAQWNVWDGGVTRKQYTRSLHAKKQSAIDEEITANSIQEQIIQTYIQILYQDAAVAVNEQILESTKILRNRAKQMFEVGDMSRADYVQMEAQVSQEEYIVINAETQLSQFKQQLKTILEIVGPENIEVEIPSIDDSQILTALPSVADVYNFAVANRPELRYSKMGIELADMDIDIAKRGYYPTIGISAGVNTNTASGMNQNWYNQIKTNLSNSIGVTLSVPIFDNRKNSSTAKRARLNRENAVINYELQEKQLYSDIENIWLNAKNAQQQYASALVNAESMQESYNLVSEQFSVGLKDIVDLTTGKNNLIQAHQTLLQSKYTAVLNRALLNFYNGNPITLK